MIFGEALLPAVLDGSKTVTRRPVKVRVNPVTGDITHACRYRPGKDYAVQPGRGQKAVARIRILDVRRLALCEVGGAEARLEGFGSVEEFREYWIGLYGAYDPDQLVDRIEFELVDGDAK